MQQKTLTILFVDVQGYTARTAQQNRQDNELFVQEISSFVKKNVEELSGKLVKCMGDGFMAVFESPTNAVMCGKQMQKRITQRNANVLDEKQFIRLRIGVSTGEVSLDEGGDVYGDAVNIASRIQSFAQPDEVFISESTFLAMNRVEVNTMDLGPQKFKNVLREIRVYKVLQGEVGSSALPTHEPSLMKNNLSMVVVAVVSVLLLAILAFSFFIIKNRNVSVETSSVSKPIEAQPTRPIKPALPGDIEFRKPLGQQSFSDDEMMLNRQINKMRRSAMEDRDFAKALQWCLENMEKYPNNVNLIMLTGEVYLWNNQIDMAESYLKKAYELSPEHPMAILRLGQFYDKKGDQVKALEMYKKYISAEPNPTRSQMIGNRIKVLESQPSM